MSGSNETTKRRRNIIIMMGIVCILLIAGLGGTIAYCTLAINNKQSEVDSANTTINQLNTTISKQDDSISQLNITVTNLQNEIASDNLTLEKLQKELDNLTGSENLTRTFAAATGVYDGFQLILTLEKTNFSLGEPINITLTITNITNQTNTFWFSAYEDFDFQVYNDTNSNIYRYSDLWIGAAVPQVIWGKTFNPGESMSQSFVWPQTFYPPTGESEGVPVSSGTYYIAGLIGSVLVTSNFMETMPIQITID